MTAHIHSFTIVRIAPPQFAEDAPYCVGIIADGDSLSTSRIDGYTDGMAVEIGQEVHPIDSPSDPAIRYRF